METPPSSELTFTVELRTDSTGRTLAGIFAPFGETALGPKGPERIMPGAIDAQSVRVVDDHWWDADGNPVDGLEVATAEIRQETGGYSATIVTDDTEDGRSFYRRIAARGRAGLSMRFRALADPIVGGVRQLERIALENLAVVNHPAYSGAQVSEIRSEPPEGEPMETTEPTAEPVATDDTAELRSDLAELTRLVKSQHVTVNETPPLQRVRPEIRTAGEWVYYMARALAPDNYSNEEHRLAVEKLRMSEDEIRAVATSDSADAVMPPQYIGPIEDAIRAGRPFANALGSMPVPATGMAIVRSYVSQGSAVAWETTEGDEGGSTAYETTDVTAAIKVVKGVNALTMQAALRGNPSTVDGLLRDQAAAMATAIDTACINGDGTLGTSTGTLAGVLDNGSIVDNGMGATWGLAEFVAGWAAGLVDVYSATNAPPRFACMHPRRWAAILGLTDTTERPAFAIDNRPSVNTFGGGAASAGTPAGGLQFAGSIGGTPIVLDANIPTGLGVGTDEDIIIMVGLQSFELYEGPRRQGQWMSPATFLTQYGQAQEAALVPIRPAGLVTISGAALT